MYKLIALVLMTLSMVGVKYAIAGENVHIENIKVICDDPTAMISWLDKNNYAPVADAESKVHVAGTEHPALLRVMVNDKGELNVNIIYSHTKTMCMIGDGTNVQFYAPPGANKGTSL